MESRSRAGCLAALLLALSLLTACAGAAGTNPARLSRAPILASVTALPGHPSDAAPPAEIQPATAEKTATAEATAMKAVTPTASSTPVPERSATPSSTPLPALNLYVPAIWREPAELAIGSLNTAGTGRLWRLDEESTADVRLVKGKEGFPVIESSIALTVPFTMRWDEVTRVEAQQILQEGHEEVIVMPWAGMDANRRALRVDGLGPADADYPFKESWSLVAEEGLDQAAADLAGILRETVVSPVVHLAAVGDVMLDRALGNQITAGNLDFPFAEVADRLRGADIAVGNLESALGDIGEPEEKRYPFRAPPQAAQTLAQAGFDLVSLANNHGMDYGPEALLQGITLLHAAGVAAAGGGQNSAAARKPQIIERNGLDIAFLSYVDVPVEAISGFDTADWTATDSSPGLAWANPVQMAGDIASAGEQADLVVVLLHSGIEYQAAPGEAQRAAAHTAVDAGAELVIGHHAHILQGIEQYGAGTIIYGAGNFAFEIDGQPETAIFHIWLDRGGVREINIEPALVQFGGQPRLAAHWEAPAIRNRIYYLSDLLNLE
ncbi:MAG: CapA family protein [Candidatus Promineifilaceae bacterium]